MSRVVVVGAGVTGLTLAYLLRTGAREVTVVEAADRVGGKLRTERLAGVPVDVGADAFLARRGPETVELCTRLGLADDLVAPATGRVLVWVSGRLLPLPQGTLLGVPTSLRSLARARVLPLAARLRAAADLVLPRSRAPAASVGEAVARRLGRGVVDRLVDPLLGGVYAGSADDLDLAAATPLLAEAARHRSLVRGARALTAGAGPSDQPVFLTLRGGLGRLAGALADALRPGAVRTSTPAIGVERRGDAWRVHLHEGDPVDADAVVLAVPAFAAAELLAGVAPAAVAPLAAIPYASVATVSLAYPRPVRGVLLEASGMLVPRTEGRLVKAATFQSAKWPHLAGEDVALVRCSVGRAGDDAPLRLPDERLVAAVHAELREATGVAAEPAAATVTRWERSIPQYAVGHAERVAAARRAVPPGVHLAGAAYDGVGVAACVAAAHRLAADL